MNQSEKSLLLTVARILRARIKETRIGKNDEDDLWALNEALAPFDPSPAQLSIMEAASGFKVANTFGNQ